MEISLTFLLCFAIAIASETREPKLQIVEDETLKDDDWIMVLHCKLYNQPSDDTGHCSDITWTYESEDKVAVAVMNDTDYYHVQNDMENMTSTLELLTSDSTEELYTCVVQCETRTFQINCWIGELQNIERRSVCSERIFNNVISATQITPNDEEVEEKSEDLKIGVSVICMLVVGMALTVIIRCRLKRQDALKHARAVIENANQCLIEARNRPPCEYPNNSQRSSVSLMIDTPIYRPVSQRSDRPSLRSHRNLERLYRENSASRASRNRLILQEMADGSQIIFVPGSKLPSYEDSQSSNHRLSMETFQQPALRRNNSGRNPFGFLTSNNRDQNSENGHLSSPPSYTSMATNEPEDENSSGDLCSTSESFTDELCMDTTELNSEVNSSLLQTDSRYQPTPLVSCMSQITTGNNSNTAARNVQSPPLYDTPNIAK
ncbi:hypothetical protein LOTGIDRAFT_152706 [Lottia gigantea]|uniref:Ig-like domain-containing protein n=1 Tax=Lottia gigantea TaxID=225164 RepID=V4AUX2_LOTGI|nr:hypothetical protein LOTGIDRAFT_152706 [Lottia gigantea]ESO97616.1 hypothetical protein LOTGIDRAFT_152706 [Lottia gigantea]